MSSHTRRQATPSALPFGSKQPLVLVGFGVMGQALAHTLPQIQTPIVIEQSAARRERAQELGLVAIDPAKPHEIQHAQIDSSSIIILAIKPQDFDNLVGQMGALLKGTMIVSIMAGVTIARLQKQLESTHIARCMPNLAARYGKAATALCFHAACSPAFRDAAHSIAAQLGSVHVMPEHLIAAHIGISGSGIAYLFQCVHAMALGGVRAGLPYATALEIVVNTLEGACTALRPTGTEPHNPIELLTQVASPGGTTIEGIAALAEGGFDATIINAVQRAVQRARAMEQ